MAALPPVRFCVSTIYFRIRADLESAPTAHPDSLSCQVEEKGQSRKFLSRRLGIDLLPGHLIKLKQTLPQAGLSRSKRMKNLDGAFKLRVPEEITQKKVLLIDDVYTTGTTIFKCARLLTKHAADVTAMTLARS